MPATAGRVRMPANNRVHSSAALQTHGIWQSAIGYDPYAPNKDETKKSSQPKASTVEPEGENAYASFQGLLALARITGSNADEARGSCKKCGRVGHLTFQCRNFLSIKDEKEKDPEAIQAAVLSGLEKLKGKGARVNKPGAESSEESSEEESESSDSEYDSEIERAIAKKHGRKPSSKVKLVKKKKIDSDSDEDSDSDSKRVRSKKRRSKKRANSDSDYEDEGGRKKRKEKRRRGGDDSSDEEEERNSRRRKSRKEKRRRRSHRYSSDDSDTSDDYDRRHKRRSRRMADSDADISGPEDSRAGRDRKRSEKRGRKRHHE